MAQTTVAPDHFIAGSPERYEAADLGLRPAVLGCHEHAVQLGRATRPAGSAPDNCRRRPRLRAGGQAGPLRPNSASTAPHRLDNEDTGMRGLFMQFINTIQAL